MRSFLDKTITYVKSNFRWSDLFLLLFGAFGAPICIEQNRFVSYSPGNLLDFNIPFYLIVAFFVLVVLFLFLYLCYELRNVQDKPYFAIVLLFIYIVLSGLITISISPNKIEMDLLDLYGNITTISAQVNEQVKCIHFFVEFFIIASIFIGLFVFPKRIKSFKTISIVIYLMHFVAFVFFIYSIVCDDYITLFKILTLQIDPDVLLKDYCPVSVFGNPNIYGMFLELCFFLSLINYSITKNKVNIVFALLFYLHLLLTICKAGILATTIIIPIYLLINLLYSIIDKNKKSILFYSVTFVLLITLFLTLLLILIFTDGYQFIFYRLDSFTGRTALWNFAVQIIESTSIIHGVGFGIYNTMIANAHTHNSSITHNWFLAMMGEGGIILVIPYLLLLLFTAFFIFKNIFSNRKIAPCACAILSFFIHSFFEDNYTLVIAMICILLLINNAWEYSNTKIRQIN